MPAWKASVLKTNRVFIERHHPGLAHIKTSSRLLGNGLRPLEGMGAIGTRADGLLSQLIKGKALPLANTGESLGLQHKNLCSHLFAALRVTWPV